MPSEEGGSIRDTTKYLDRYEMLLLLAEGLLGCLRRSAKNVGRKEEGTPLTPLPFLKSGNGAEAGIRETGSRKGKFPPCDPPY